MMESSGSDGSKRLNFLSVEALIVAIVNVGNCTKAPLVEKGWDPCTSDFGIDPVHYSAFQRNYRDTTNPDFALNKIVVLAHPEVNYRK